MDSTAFRRTGLGWWGSLWDWTLEAVCCVAMQRHEWAYSAEWKHCERCGIAARLAR